MTQVAAASIAGASSLRRLVLQQVEINLDALDNQPLALPDCLTHLALLDCPTAGGQHGLIAGVFLKPSELQELCPGRYAYGLEGLTALEVLDLSRSTALPPETPAREASVAQRSPMVPAARPPTFATASRARD